METKYLIQRNLEFSQGHETIIPGVYYPRNKNFHRSRRKTNRETRIVFKNGDFNIVKSTSKRFRIKDWFFNTVEARWRWTLLNFFTAFTTDWLFFGFIYYMIAMNHGDLEIQNQNADFVPCIENIYSFTSAFLFSIEVHTTVAYGRRSITLECPQAILTMCLQCILSSIIQAFLVGILFVKLSRPKSRTQTILFSKNAVVNLSDDKLSLIFRVGDIREARILNIKISLFLLRLDSVDKYIDDEQIELKTTLDGNESTFFLWPLSVTHVIDKHSPLYKLSAANLLCGKLEILAVFEGMIETTGQPVQARSSYTDNDILWGHRFISMVNTNISKHMFDVDYAKLNETEQIETPLCSACEYENAMYLVTN